LKMKLLLMAEECYICLEIESEAGEMCIRACDFCRRSNAHLSCLHQYHKINESQKPTCPMCKRSLGGRFCVLFFSHQLTLFENKYGLNHRKVAITLTNLGNACGKIGDMEKKRRLLERALTIKEREYGLNHVAVAVTLTNLGNAYGELGDVEKQRQLLERALLIEELEYGRHHRELAITLTNLDNTYACT